MVEVFLAAVQPRDPLGGKVIGLGLLGIAQLVAIAVPALVAALAFGTLDLPAGSSPSILGVRLLWFVLGYVIYAALFAAAGSLVTRQEDLQSVITPISLLAQGVSPSASSQRPIQAAPQRASSRSFLLSRHLLCQRALPGPLLESASRSLPPQSQPSARCSWSLSPRASMSA